MSTRKGKELRARIGALIAEQSFGPGDRLPPERELAATLHVSRTTLRSVLAEMEQSGAVVRTVGRAGGTFVADHADPDGPTKIDRGVAASVPTFLTNQGFRAGTRVVSAALIEAGPKHVENLGVELCQLVVELRRIRLADGVPISFETMYLAESRFPNLIERKLSGSLAVLLAEEYGALFGVISESIEVVAAPLSTARMLEIAVGEPLLEVTRVSRDEYGNGLEYSVDYFRSDLTRLVVESKRGDDLAGLRVASQTLGVS